MRNRSEIVKKITLFLCVMIVICLSLAALGGVLESFLLVYCWYLALFGIAALMVLTMLLAVNKLFNVLSRQYHRVLQQWNGDVHGQHFLKQIHQ